MSTKMFRGLPISRIGSAAGLLVMLGGLTVSGAAVGPLHAAEADTATPATSLPAEQQAQGGVAYVTGGVDLGESTAIKAAMNRYPLVVEVFESAGGKNQYTAGATLTVSTPKGDQVAAVTMNGPFALLKLDPGRYAVKVDYQGRTEARQVTVRKGGSARSTFVFKPA